MTTLGINRRWIRHALAAATAGLLLAVPATTGAAAGSEPEISIGFDAMRTGRVASSGSTAVTTAVSTANRGSLTATADPDGRGAAARFPRWDGTAPAARAVVTVMRRGAGDPLSPGARAFRFGAAFKLDAVSEGGRLDDGNNLVQRGLFGDPGQYKLQVDDGRVSCRIRGAAGAVVVRSRVVVTPIEWYSSTCSRVGGQVTLAVVGPAGRTTRTSVSARTGSVDVGSGGVRLSSAAGSTRRERWCVARPTSSTAWWTTSSTTPTDPAGHR